MMDLKSIGLLTKKMDLESIGLLNTMMDFLNQPLKSLVLSNEMMGFFRPNVLISDQRTYNKHDEDNLLWFLPHGFFKDQRYDPISKF